MHAYFSCGIDQVKVSGTDVKGGEDLSCILLGYLELRPTWPQPQDTYYGHSTFI